MVEDSTLEGTVEGNTYAVGTPFLTQTGSSAIGLLYFKCNEAVSLFAKTFSSQARWASGATFQNYLINVYKDVDDSLLTGTWVDFTPLNVNFGNSNELAGVFKYGSPTGAGGFSGLTPSFQLAFPVNVYNQIATNLIFPKGIGFADNRILVTNDKDFGEKVYREKHPHRGVISLRLEDERAMAKIQVIRRFLENYADKLSGNFVVITESSVRFARNL